MKTSIKKSAVRVVITLASGLGMASPWAQPTVSAMPVHIDAQPLDGALNAWAAQTGYSVLVSFERAAQGRMAPRVEGSYTPEVALKMLLSSTDLRYEFVNERTVAIRAEAQAGASVAEPDAGTRVAQVETPSSSAGEGPGEDQEKSSGSSSSSETEKGKISEIIVTAQKREERLQDVPISISVLRGDDLDKSTVRDVTEALGRVPGVTIVENATGRRPQVSVRGVAAPSGSSGSNPSAYYLDSAPFGFVSGAFVPSPDAYDLDRIEVLRGPQGTLYGANALNGVVRVLTHDADLERFELKTRGLTSGTEDGGWNYRGDVAVNVPIVEGKLAARAVLGYQNLSGWIDKPNKKDANDVQDRTARLKLNAQPTEQLAIGISAWISRADQGAPSLGPENRTSLDEPISDDFDVYNIKVGYQFPGISVTSTTSYLDYENRSILDVGFAPQDAGYNAQTFAEEIAINSTYAGPWRWTAGAMYRDSKDRLVASYRPALPTPLATRSLSQSYALYGELTRLFLNGKWEFTVGSRYFEDDVGYEELSRLTAFSPNQLLTSDTTFHATTPRVVLSWHPNPQMNVYASYGQGFRSGWQNNPLAPLPPVKPDKLKSYELGSKGSLLGGRLAFDAALYYMNWKDVQQILSVLVPGTNICCTSGGVNGESASGVGFDFSVTAKPVDRLGFGVNVSWNDLGFDGQVISNRAALFAKGERLINSAEYTAGAFADYDFPLGASGFEGRFSVSANHTSGIPNRGLVGQQVTLLNGDPTLIGRTSLAISAPRHWTAALFVDNLSDENGSPLKFPTGSMRIRPRTVGVQFEYKLDE